MESIEYSADEIEELKRFTGATREEASAPAEFVSDLIELCRKHNATLFPRRDSERLYVSAMVGEVWLDFTRISGYDTERKR